jgi:biotin carboxyl carrier protein
VILILEAMKMQNDIVATAAGTVKAVHVQEGAVVSQDDPLVTVA